MADIFRIGTKKVRVSNKKSLLWKFVILTFVFSVVSGILGYFMPSTATQNNSVVMSLVVLFLVLLSVELEVEK